MHPEVLIIGCGFLGEASADLFSAQGKSVLGVVRSASSCEKLRGNSFACFPCDVTDSVSVAALASRLKGVPLAIYAVSSGRGGADEYASVYRDGLRRILESWQPQKILFISSTSVYGQNDGSRVTEDSPTLPDRETGKILLEAEQIALKAGGIVARFSGIYGPDRSVLLRKFLAGEAVLEEGGHRIVNQIHRDDGASALLRLASRSLPSGIFNVTDDTPATQREVYGWMSEFLKRPMPPEGSANPNRKRGITSKRISNAKLRSLGWAPIFPSYRDALPQLVNTSDQEQPE